MKALKQFELEAVDRSHGISKEVVEMTVVLTRELSEGGPATIWGLSAKGRGCVGPGQRMLPYFFMKTTVTEERQNEWPVRRNENK